MTPLSSQYAYPKVCVCVSPTVFRDANLRYPTTLVYTQPAWDQAGYIVAWSTKYLRIWKWDAASMYLLVLAV